MKSSCTADHEGFPPILIKQLAETLSHPLSLIYSSFMPVGNLPSVWKRATVMPVFKSGSSSLVKNYRPISLTCIFCKLMEHVITRQTSSYLLQHGLISSHYHGFITRLSSTTNLIETLTDWTLAIQNRHSVTVAYIDFCKAFDSVCHRKLLLKLDRAGIPGNL